MSIMKEMLNQNILAIEDRELRSLVKYEQIMAWYRSGGVQKSIAAYRAQIAAADQAKAVAELRVAQINVIEQAVARFDARSVRNAQMAQVAAQHRADAAERQRIHEAVDEVLALEEIVPADDIDDILSQVSAALGIELPSDADRADICQRGHKSMNDLKRELGPSLANPVQQVQSAVADVTKAGDLIADVRRASILQGMEASPVGERYFEIGQERQNAEKALWDFIRILAAKAYGLTNEQVSMPTGFRTLCAWFRPDGTEDLLPFTPDADMAAV
ncbi:hypothetical protein [Rhizobium leguminosarum]|uniref:hypothetical protein n=1 Tax=Rhizobium leguminosarum TaxID=384 RepID=UPI0014426E09|nr:hypothetical protein [Rhizobium leguminosarum]MBY3026503.1 hypothetical protein [Rhizobium leguminosarum]NKL74111.1 hypothetical protein [Rhizobium leguminosarum bv. viciae]